MKHQIHILALCTAALVATAFTAQANDLRIRNRWTQGYVNNEQGPTQVSAAAPGAFGASWVIEPVPGTAFKRFRNRGNNGYLNIEGDAAHGIVQTSEVPPNYATSWWLIERIDGSPFVRLQNSWTKKYLNNQQGPPRVTDIEPGWFSAMWRLEELRSPAEVAQSCATHVQGHISWNYAGTTQWNPENVTRLCGKTTEPTEPGKCFDQVMHSNINWGGGTKWEWQNALNLCAGTNDSSWTIGCFQDKIGQGSMQITWQKAIADCGQKF